MFPGLSTIRKINLSTLGREGTLFSTGGGGFSLSGNIIVIILDTILFRDDCGKTPAGKMARIKSGTTATR